MRARVVDPFGPESSNYAPIATQVAVGNQSGSTHLLGDFGARAAAASARMWPHLAATCIAATAMT